MQKEDRLLQTAKNSSFSAEKIFIWKLEKNQT